MSEGKATNTCSKCKFWSPQYLGVGQCMRQGRMHAAFWVTDDKATLLTVASFYCQAFEPVPEAKDDISVI